MTGNSPDDVGTGNPYSGEVLSHDEADMLRLGKTQQFKRNFTFWSTFGFVAIYMSTWEFVIIGLSSSIATAGYGSFFWTYIGSVLCYSTVVLSLAEMSSMSPTAGGQYHWVSEYAPKAWQKQASYASGWMASLGWIAGLSSGIYISGSLVRICVNITHPDFVFTNWQTFLILLVQLGIIVILNTLGTRALPAMQVVSLTGHTVGFLIFTSLFWALCRPLNGARDVFLDFHNNGGWSNYGAVCLLNQVSIIFSMLGSDTVSHICECLPTYTPIYL